MSSSGLPSTRSIKNKMTDSNFEPVKEENNIVECRACLEEINSDSTYYNLFDCVGQQEQMRSTIAEKLSNIAQIEISEADELPKVICDTCCSFLKTAHSFAVAVRKTDELLRQKFANIQKESENIWPKPIQISNNIIYTHYIPHMETKEEVLSEDECFAKQDSDEHNISKGEIKVESNSLDCEINTPKIDAGITVNCSILYCKNKNTKGGSINFMSFPKDPTIILKWLKHCKPNANSTNGRVCSIHFAASDYQRTMKQKIMNEHPERCRQIKPDAVPSLHLNPVFEIPPTDKGSENIMSYLEPDVFETDNNFNCPVVKVRTSEHDKERQPRKRRRESSPQSSETNSTEGFMIPVKVYKELLNYKSKYEHIKQKLLKIFTPGQISRLCSDNMNLVRWSVEDIAPAITLRSITPNGYSYLREVIGIPYPAFATLAQWTREFDVKEGVLDKIISLMKSKIKNFDSKQRIVVLSFNEISIWNQRETGNNSYGDYITCQCVMVRSLYGRWKQLIYYEFDQDMTADILKDLIQRMYDINLIVRAVTCDQGKGNPDLLNSLNIGAKSPQNTWFPHPANKNVRVHVFIDVPCLLKLARNNFVEHGFLYEDKLLTKETLVKFLEYLTVNDLKNIRNKLTLNHLNVDGPIKKSISAAAELFSNDTSVALEWCGNNGFLEDENLYEVSQVLKIFSEWFDIFNARIISEEDKKAFGQHFDHQFEVLETMNSLISSIKTGEKKNKLCFQRGIIISNKSLCNLFCDLQNLLGAEFEGILTSRLNLDLLNHFFSHIEDIDDNYVAGLSLKYRLKQYIIGKHSLESKSTSIYEDPDVPCLVIPLEIIETVKKTKSHATRCGAAAVRRLTDAASVFYI